VESGLRTFQWTYQKNVTGASGVDAVWLDCISFPPFDSGAIDSPTNLTLVISGNNIELNWDSVDGADSYNVYRSTEPTGTFDFIQSTGENSYIDSNALLSGTNYFYRVTAVNSAK
jgi:fibronectin type 3 domain-containing protein